MPHRTLKPLAKDAPPALPPEKFAEYYNIIAERALGDDPNSIQNRVNIVRSLENACRTCFFNTRDFHDKCRGYIGGRGAKENAS